MLPRDRNPEKGYLGAVLGEEIWETAKERLRDALQEILQETRRESEQRIQGLMDELNESRRLLEDDAGEREREMAGSVERLEKENAEQAKELTKAQDELHERDRELEVACHQLHEKGEGSEAEIGNLQERLDAQEEELEAARERLQGQSDELDDAQVRLDARERELEDAGERLSGRKRELEETRGRLHEREAEIEELQERLQGGEGELESARDELQSKEQELDEVQKRILSMEQELESARQEASQALPSGGDYLSEVGKEIQLSMNGIMEMSALLAQTFLDTEQEKFVNSLWGSASSLLGILNNILEISQIEAGTLKIDPCSFEPRQMIEEVLEDLHKDVSDKGLSLDSKIDARCPQRVIGDEGRIKQVLRNFAEHAIANLPTGELRISMGCREEHSGSARFRFAVTEGGSGMSAEQLERLLEMPAQPASAVGRGGGDSGLGLPLSKKLIELMGGSVGARSREGRGSTLHFELTMQVVERASAGVPVAD